MSTFSNYSVIDLGTTRIRLAVINDPQQFNADFNLSRFVELPQFRDYQANSRETLHLGLNNAPIDEYRNIIKSVSKSSQNVFIILPSSSVFVKVSVLPLTSNSRELTSQINTLIGKLLPQPISAWHYNYQILERSQRNISLLIEASPLKTILDLLFK